MTLMLNKPVLTLEEYLEAERRAAKRHEFVDGHLYAMAGGSRHHNRITLNIASALLAASRGTPCEVYSSDMRLVIRQPSLEISYYPDVFVACQNEDVTDYRTNPCLIVEVLSDSTARFDQTEKKLNYQRLETIKTYLIVHQNLKRVEINQRDPDGQWVKSWLENEGLIELECPNTTLTLEQIYEDVDFSSPKD